MYPSLVTLTFTESPVTTVLDFILEPLMVTVEYLGEETVIVGSKSSPDCSSTLTVSLEEYLSIISCVAYPLLETRIDTSLSDSTELVFPILPFIFTSASAGKGLTVIVI